MKRIGNDQFAVEFELQPSAGEREANDWLSGRMRFVVGGAPVGDYEHAVSLNAGTVAVAGLLKNRGRRVNPSLMTQSAEELFRTAFGALAEDRGQPDDQVAEDWRTYSPLYGIARGLEVFDDWDAFLVEDADRARYVWRNARESPDRVHEQALRPGQFDEVLEAFMSEMRRLAPSVLK